MGRDRGHGSTPQITLPREPGSGPAGPATSLPLSRIRFRSCPLAGSLSHSLRLRLAPPPRRPYPQIAPKALSTLAPPPPAQALALFRVLAPPRNLGPVPILELTPVQAPPLPQLPFLPSSQTEPRPYAKPRSRHNFSPLLSSKGLVSYPAGSQPRPYASAPSKDPTPCARSLSK